MAGGGVRFVLPYQTVIDAAGVPIPGALLNFYESGTDTRLATYSNVGLTVPNQNPVPADAGGRFPSIFLLPVAYKVVLTDALGDEIWTADPVQGSANGGTLSLAIRTVAGDTTVLASDGIIEVNAAGGAVRVTFPLALGTPGQGLAVTIVKTDATRSPVNIVSDDDPTVLRYNLIQPANGADMQSCEVYSNGTAIRAI